MFLDDCNIVTWDNYMDAHADTGKPEYAEENLGKVGSLTGCYKKVKEHRSEKKKEQANGMTWVEGGSKDCYAKYSVTHIKSFCNVTCKTCIFGSMYHRKYSD